MALVPDSSHASASGGGVTVLSYVQLTSSIAISATDATTADTVVTAAAITSDGVSVYCIEVYAPRVATGATLGSRLECVIYDGSTDIGECARFESSAAAVARWELFARRFLTPSAGSHTYSLRAWRELSNGSVAGGAGGAGVALPGYIRVTTGS